MKLKTYGSLFDHACQIKDMKFSGFSPTTLRYTCNECGGHLILKLDRSQWGELFGDRPSFRLSKKVLTALEALGVAPVEGEDEAQAATLEIASFSSHHNKFHWEPAHDEEADDEE